MSEPSNSRQMPRKEAENRNSRAGQALAGELQSQSVAIKRAHLTGKVADSNVNASAVDDGKPSLGPPGSLLEPAVTARSTLPAFSQFGPALESENKTTNEVVTNIPGGRLSSGPLQLEPRISRMAISEKCAAFDEGDSNPIPSQASSQLPKPVLGSPFPWSERDTHLEDRLSSMTAKEYRRWKRANVQSANEHRGEIQFRGAVSATVALAATIFRGPDGARAAGVEVRKADSLAGISQQCDTECKCGCDGCPGKATSERAI